MHAAYAQHYRTLWERHWWWRSREAYVLGWLHDASQGLSERPNILDVGCGDGLFFERLNAYGEVDGVESDGSLVQDPRWAERIRVGTIDDAPREGYDVVLMLDVLEHIADDRAALRSVRERLRPGGRLLMTVPALQWLWSGHDVINAHHRRYHRARLESLLLETGFAVETVRYFFVWTVAPMLLRRWLRPGREEPSAEDARVTIPPAPINRALTRLSRVEHAVGRRLRWPLGSSLFALARA